MLNLKKIKRTKRELKYIDIIANIIFLTGRCDDGEFTLGTYEMLKHFKLSNYDIKLILRIFRKLDYYTLKR